jgi:hypothetical protein
MYRIVILGRFYENRLYSKNIIFLSNFFLSGGASLEDKRRCVRIINFYYQCQFISLGHLQ